MCKPNFNLTSLSLPTPTPHSHNREEGSAAAWRFPCIQDSGKREERRSSRPCQILDLAVINTALYTSPFAALVLLSSWLHPFVTPLDCQYTLHRAEAAALVVIPSAGKLAGVTPSAAVSPHLPIVQDHHTLADNAQLETPASAAALCPA